MGDGKRRPIAALLTSSLLSRTEFTELRVPQLQRLSRRLWARFERTGERADLEDALRTDHRIVEVTPNDDPHLPERLNELSTSLLTRFSQFSEPNDLDRAVDADRRAVELTSDDDRMRPPRLSNLALCLRTRYDHFGDVGDLEHALDSHRRAVATTPDDDARLPFRLNNLASCLRCRFALSGDSAVADIDEAVEADRRAVALLAPGHPDLPLRLGNLAVSLITRFDRSGGHIDLEDAIAAGIRAASLEGTRDGMLYVSKVTSGRLMRMNNLSVALLRRFDVCGEKVDLEEALSTWHNVYELEFDYGHTFLDKYANTNEYETLNFSHLNNSRIGHWAFREATCYWMLYVHYGDPNHLTAALRKFRASVHEGDVDSEVSARLNGIATCLLARFEHHRDPADLEVALEADRMAIAYAPDDPARLTNLATSLFARYRLLGDVNDLAQAHGADLRAVALTEDWEPALPLRLGNLACSLHAQSRICASVKPVDLEDTLKASRRAVELASERYPMLLVNLGVSLTVRFVHSGDQRDVEDAEDVIRRAVSRVPDDHPQKSRMLYSLALVLIARSATHRTREDFDAIIALQEGIFDQPSRGYGRDFLRKGRHLVTSVLPMERLHYARAYVRFLTDSANAEFCEPDSQMLLKAYARLMDILPELVWHGHGLQRQIAEAARARVIVGAAVSAALEAGGVVKAMVWQQGVSSFISGF